MFGPLAREFPVAGQDDEPLEIQGHPLARQGPQGLVVAQALVETLPSELKLVFELGPLGATVDGPRSAIRDLVNPAGKPGIASSPRRIRCVRT